MGHLTLREFAIRLKTKTDAWRMEMVSVTDEQQSEQGGIGSHSPAKGESSRSTRFLASSTRKFAPGPVSMKVMSPSEIQEHWPESEIAHLPLRD